MGIETNLCQSDAHCSVRLCQQPVDDAIHCS